MRVIIAGSRSIIPTEPEIRQYVRMFEAQFQVELTRLACGMAKGVDLAGYKWASRNGVPIDPYPADWQTHGKAAGHIRNKKMAQNADGLILVWDGESRGSRSMLQFAKAEHLNIMEVVGGEWKVHNGQRPMDRHVQSEPKNELARLQEERDALRALVQDYETRLTAVMPADMDDWHENAKSEWPEIAAAVIKNLRESELYFIKAFERSYARVQELEAALMKVVSAPVASASAMFEAIREAEWALGGMKEEKNGQADHAS